MVQIDAVQFSDPSQNFLSFVRGIPYDARIGFDLADGDWIRAPVSEPALTVESDEGFPRWQRGGQQGQFFVTLVSGGERFPRFDRLDLIDPGLFLVRPAAGP